MARRTRFRRRNFAKRRRNRFGRRTAFSRRRRFNRRRFRGRFRSRRLGRSLALTAPKTKLVKLRYHKTVLFDVAGTGTATTYAFRANDMYDPQEALGGLQPMGFDQWMAFYKKFTVIGSSCTVKWLPSTISNIVPMQFGIQISDVANEYNTMDEDRIREFKDIQPLRYSGILGVSGTSPTRPVSLTKRFSTKRWFKDDIAHQLNQSGVGDYSGTASASPDKQAYFNITCIPVHGNDPGAQNLDITIDYIAILSDPVVLTQST